MPVQQDARTLCKMEDKRLIECVRKYEFLYNVQQPKYMDSVRKEMTWKEISEQLKQPGMFIKLLFI